MAIPTTHAIALENTAKAPVEAWLAAHDPMDWPNLRHPAVRYQAALALEAERVGDLAALAGAWVNWACAVWAQVPATERPAEAA